MKIRKENETSSWIFAKMSTTGKPSAGLPKNKREKTKINKNQGKKQTLYAVTHKKDQKVQICTIIHQKIGQHRIWITF